MRKVSAIVASEWRYVLRDPIAILMLVVLPLIFTAVLSLVFGGTGNAPLRIGLVSENATVTAELRQVLAQEQGLLSTTMSLTEAKDRLRHATLDAALIVPGGERPTRALQVLTDPSTERGYQAYTRLIGLQAIVTGRMTAEGLAAQLLPGGADAKRAGDMYAALPLPEVEIVRTWKQVAEGVLQVSPGMLVMFILMFAAYSGEGIVLERANGTLRRLLAAPLTGWTYLTGRILGKVTLGLFQFLLLAGFGAFVFKVNWGNAAVPMIVTALIFSCCCAAFGLLLGVLCRTPDQLSAAATIVCLALAALGGTWWPLDVTPKAIQAFGRVLPTGQAMKAFQALILYGPSGIADARASWLGLTAWTLAFFIPGALLFRRHQSDRGPSREKHQTRTV